jgi:non-ribosomal peptide synthetase component F
MMLTTALHVLIAQYTQQSDTIIGTAVSNRKPIETERMIGCFANTVPLRADLSGDPTFVELLKRLRPTIVADLAHQDMPFEMLLQLLKIERDIARNPLFQIMFALHDYLRQPIELPQLSLIPLDIDIGSARLDLTIEVFDAPGGLQGSFEYNSDLWESSSISRLCTDYTTLLDGIVSCPGSRLSELPRTTNGKMDHRAFPLPAQASPQRDQAPFVEPRTKLEKAIAAIWADVLKRDNIGIHDNFFDIEGSSLLLVQLWSALRANLGTDMAVVDLFQHPTIALQSQYLRHAEPQPSEIEDVKDRSRRQIAALNRNKIARTLNTRSRE